MVGFACGDGTGSGIVPSSITKIGGDMQSGLLGDSLDQRLRVSVRGSDNQPMANATVTWRVTAGSATVPMTTTTDAAGETAALVQVGTTHGTITVSATVTGVAPAVFTVIALNPCNVFFVFEDTAQGALVSYDCQFGGPYYTDLYTYELTSQSNLTLHLTAAFDTYLEKYTIVPVAFVGVNNNATTTDLNSRLNVILGAGEYVLAASSNLALVTGAYTLSRNPRSRALPGCPDLPRLPWLTRGVSFADTLELTDCSTTRTGGGVAYSDRVLVSLSSTRPITATVASGVFPPRIELYQVDSIPTLVHSVDGVAGSATLTYTPPSGGDIVYQLEITTIGTDQSGAYTLTVGGPTPGEAATVLPLGPGAWPRLRARRPAARD